MQVLSMDEVNEVSGASAFSDAVAAAVGGAASYELGVAGAELGAWGGPAGAAFGALIGFGLGYAINNW